VQNPIGPICAIANKYGCLKLVDTISSLGAVPFEFDEWGVDAAVTASQKCLMSPTGLAFVALSEKALHVMKNATLPKYYLDFKKILDFLKRPRPETPGSTPVSLMLAVHEGTRMIMEEGFEQVCKRHERVAQAIRQAFIALGCELFPRRVVKRCSTCSAVTLPNDVLASDVKNVMLKDYGIVATGGLGPLPEDKERVMRFGHMGNFHAREATTLVSVFGAVLNSLRCDVAMEKGLEKLNQRLWQQIQ
jgi:aspartate aminotransferase-like enzyme